MALAPVGNVVSSCPTGATSRRRAVRSASLLALALVASAPRVALAQAHAPTAAELSSARQLFDDAVAAEDRGDWAAALATYERIVKITSSPVVLYRLAVCHDKLGHVVEAINAYQLAAQHAEQKGQDDLVGDARKHEKALSARAPRLVVNVPADADEVAIELDGKPINAALAGASMLVDPGERRLVVRARNYEGVFDVKITIAEKEVKTVAAALGAKRVVVAAPPATAPIAAGPAPIRDAPAPPAPAPNRLPIYLAGAATVGLGAGALVTGLLAHGKHSDYVAANDAPEPGSFDERTAMRDEGQSLALVSTVLTAGAVVAGGVTAYFFFSAPPAEASAKRAPGGTAFVAPWLGAEGGGLVAWGSL